jgi:hypothetical protein
MEAPPWLPTDYLPDAASQTQRRRDPRTALAAVITEVSAHIWFNLLKVDQYQPSIDAKYWVLALTSDRNCLIASRRSACNYDQADFGFSRSVL